MESTKLESNKLEEINVLAWLLLENLGKFSDDDCHDVQDAKARARAIYEISGGAE